MEAHWRKSHWIQLMSTVMAEQRNVSSEMYLNPDSLYVSFRVSQTFHFQEVNNELTCEIFPKNTTKYSRWIKSQYRPYCRRSELQVPTEYIIIRSTHALLKIKYNSEWKPIDKICEVMCAISQNGNLNKFSLQIYPSCKHRLLLQIGYENSLPVSLLIKWRQHQPEAILLAPVSLLWHVRHS